MPQTPEASILQLTQDAIEGDPKVTRKGIYHLAKWQNYQVVNGRRGSDLEKLRRILKALEKRVAALEESARIALGAPEQACHCRLHFSASGTISRHSGDQRMESNVQTGS